MSNFDAKTLRTLSSAKIRSGSKNKLNIARATIKALSMIHARRTLTTVDSKINNDKVDALSQVTTTPPASPKVSAPITEAKQSNGKAK